MSNEHQIIQAVYAAKKDDQKADDLIRDYIPFIRSEASKSLHRQCTDKDDAFSIAMIAFHEAILHYEREKGTFLQEICKRVQVRQRIRVCAGAGDQGRHLRYGRQGGCDRDFQR